MGLLHDLGAWGNKTSPSKTWWQLLPISVLVHRSGNELVEFERVEKSVSIAVLCTHHQEVLPNTVLDP